MRTVYETGGSNARYRKAIRTVLVVTAFMWIIAVLASGGDVRSRLCCGTYLLGFALGVIIVILLLKWLKEGGSETKVIVEDQGVIAYGNYLLWDEIKELREDPEEGYQLIFRPLNKKGETLHFVNIDDFLYFDNFVEQLREHGVEIKINHW